MFLSVLLKKVIFGILTGATLIYFLTSKSANSFLEIQPRSTPASLKLQMQKVFIPGDSSLSQAVEQSLDSLATNQSKDIATQVTATKDKVVDQQLLQSCQDQVRQMNYGRVYRLRQSERISLINVKKLNLAEKKALEHYFKEYKTGFLSANRENFFEISTLIFYTSNKSILGYKVIIEKIDEGLSHQVTYFAHKNGKILFFHAESSEITNHWICEEQNLSKTL